MVEIGEAAEKNGLSDMSLDEINAEIDASDVNEIPVPIDKTVH